MTPLLPNLLAVVVPEDFYGTRVTDKYFEYHTLRAGFGKPTTYLITLPPGQYELIKPYVVEKYSEEDAKGVVEGKIITTYSTEVDMDLKPIGETETTYWIENAAHKTAKASLLSLCKKHSLDPNQTIILKRIVC